MDKSGEWGLSVSANENETKVTFDAGWDRANLQIDCRMGFDWEWEWKWDEDKDDDEKLTH